MIGDVFVIDGVAHPYDFSPGNYVDPEMCAKQASLMYNGFLTRFSPPGEPKWIFDEKYMSRPPDTDLVASAFFAESPTDAAIFHEVPNWGLFKETASPLWPALELRDRYPGRVALYGGISPWYRNPVEEVDRLVEDHGVVGIKLYPMDIVDGKPHSFLMDDPEVCFPILERAQQKGLRVVAIHKAMPMRGFPLAPFGVSDLEPAFLAFPDLSIEIVHGGYAFLEETAMLVGNYTNAVINLEGTTAYLNTAPKKFADILGTFIGRGAADRIIWATGCTALHPRPLLERFWDLQFSDEMVEGYGISPLTDEVKRGILGENAARIVGLDIEQMKDQMAGDEFSLRSELAEPWTGGH
jgi:predicted TIM-barrel fold metal-dependent hydrolase